MSKVSGNWKILGTFRCEFYPELRTDAQNSMEKYSNDFLSSVRTYNSGEVGGLINELLTELNYIDVGELEQSGFKSFYFQNSILEKLGSGCQKAVSEI